MGENKKSLMIYFHHMDVARDKKGADNTPYNLDAICNSISLLLDIIVKKDLLYCLRANIENEKQMM